MNKSKWGMFVTAVTEAIYDTLMTVLDRLSIFASAAVPASLLGYSLAQALIAIDMNFFIAVSIGTLAAFGLEGYGLKALRVRFSDGASSGMKQRAYVYLITAVVLLWADAIIIYVANGTLNGLIPAVIGSGFAVLSYNYYGIAGEESAIEKRNQNKALAAEEEKEAVQDRISWEREQADLARRDAQELALARIENNTRAKIAKAKIETETKLKRNSEPVKQRNETETKRNGETETKRNGETETMKLIRVQLETDFHRSNADIADIVGCTAQYVGRVRSKLNGSVKHGNN